MNRTRKDPEKRPMPLMSPAVMRVRTGLRVKRSPKGKENVGGGKMRKQTAGKKIIPKENGKT